MVIKSEEISKNIWNKANYQKIDSARLQSTVEAIEGSGLESSDCKSFQRLTKYCKGLTIGIICFIYLVYIFSQVCFG